MESNIDRYRMEANEKWREWVDKIPPIKFNPDWNIKIIPPFSGAMARFIVKKDEASVSVYLDCYENLGYFEGGPYWEIYPYANDVYRIAMNGTDELIQRIQESIDEQDNQE